MPASPGAAAGARVRALRTSAGLSLSALAAEAGIGKGSLSELESGRRNPTLDTLYALARPLGGVVAETTALGAAYAAGLAVGFWSGCDELRANWQEGARWTPTADRAGVEGLYRTWQKAVTKTFDWADQA